MTILLAVFDSNYWGAVIERTCVEGGVVKIGQSSFFDSTPNVKPHAANIPLDSTFLVLDLILISGPGSLFGPGDTF